MTVAVVAFLVATLADAEPAPTPVLERSPLEAKLRQNAVDALFQDREGFLWLGTREGLVRWDGRTARYWHSIPFDENSLPHNMVLYVDQDARGDLWLVTRPFIHGPSRVSRLVAPAMARFVRYPVPDAESVLDPSGRPWLVAADGIYAYDRSHDRFELRIPLARRTEERPFKRRAAFDADGRLWMVNGSRLEHCDLERRDCRGFEPFSPPLPYSFLMKLDGRVRAPTPRGLGCPRPDPPRLEHCDDLGGWSPGSQVMDVVRDRDGNLWAATVEDIWRITAAGPEKIPLRSVSGTVADDFFNLFADRSGGVWAGSPWGLFHWSPHDPPFELLIFETQDPGRAPAPILAIHEDDRGALWLGTLGDGLYVLGPGEKRRHLPLPPLGPGTDDGWGTYVWALAESEGRLWIGTFRGLLSLDPDSETITRVRLPPHLAPETPAIDVRRIVERPDGGLWVLAPRYLYGYRAGAWERIEHGEPTVDDLVIRGPSELWIATSGDGLRRLDPRSGEIKAFRHDPDDPRSLAARGLVSLLVDGDGTLWIGTNRGLDRLRSDGETFDHVLGPEDLPGSTVLALLEGPRRLWVSTNRGLVTVPKDPSPADGSATTRAVVWDASKGVGNREFNRGARLVDRRGRLLFGGDRGVTRFDPEQIHLSTYDPPVRLERLTTVSRRGLEHHNPVAGEAIRLGPDVTAFTLELATIDLTGSADDRFVGARFALRLEGVDPDWIHLGSEGTATYAGVPPGRYTLLAKAANGDGVWGSRGLEVELEVVPPFYRTALVQVVAGATAGCLLFGLGALIAGRRYRRRLELWRFERRREEDRRRISRDLHDDLGAGLTQIVLLSERERAHASAGRNAFGQIADKARGLIEAVREIIWSIDPEHDRLDLLSARLRGSVAEMLEAAELPGDLHFPENPPPLPVSPQVRRNLVLVAREAVHNAVRHGEARRVMVRFTDSDDFLELDVADDGRGFDPQAVVGGRGLGNLRSRAEDVGGELRVESAPGKGTRIRFRVPIGSGHGGGPAV